MAPLRRLDNVEIKGGYARFSDLLAGHYMAFVYTSQWDGLPNVLLEAARYLPIVAPAVGGIPELLERAHLVPSIEDIDGFVASIRQLHDSPSLRLARLDGQRLALAGHSFPMFMEHLSRVPGYFGDGGATRRQEAE
jgi:glycosyltransferase involved in cell wall biosynthesis